LVPVDAEGAQSSKVFKKTEQVAIAARETPTRQDYDSEDDADVEEAGEEAEDTQRLVAQAFLNACELGTLADVLERARTERVQEADREGALDDAGMDDGSLKEVLEHAHVNEASQGLSFVCASQPHQPPNEAEAIAQAAEPSSTLLGESSRLRARAALLDAWTSGRLSSVLQEEQDEWEFEQRMRQAEKSRMKTTKSQGTASQGILHARMVQAVTKLQAVQRMIVVQKHFKRLRSDRQGAAVKVQAVRRRQFAKVKTRELRRLRSEVFGVPLTVPVTNAVFIVDPRIERVEEKRPPRIGVVAFSFPGASEPCDELCRAMFLGNSWRLGSGAQAVRLASPGKPNTERTFTNSEAAFQATQFWDRADEFERLSADEAIALAKRLNIGRDPAYGGFKRSWNAMMAVLHSKFRLGSALADALLETGNAFLLWHGSAAGRDELWSNNHVGDGINWLGMQLMLVRDELRAELRAQTADGGAMTWLQYIDGIFDLEEGKPYNEETAQAWQQTVQLATGAVVKELAQEIVTIVTCARAECSKPTWNGKAQEFCGQACRKRGIDAADGTTKRSSMQPGLRQVQQFLPSNDKSRLSKLCTN
jgi:predicted NAD-dependent protein-ADP-ribosyltransferase YbiA (DUF1768 family)